MHKALLSKDFLQLSARLGQDPLQVQGAGGNTSIKSGDVMWIKASGTALADAERQDIFVAVDREAARAEIDGKGDGSCKAAVLDPEMSLRPSIETTFHAALDWPVVVHTHSVATLTHAIAPEGREALKSKLDRFHPVLVPYAKPGLPLTREILNRATARSRLFILENHGVIVAGSSVAETARLLTEVENRLALPVMNSDRALPPSLPPDGFEWGAAGWMARDPAMAERVGTQSYYPDHVVFLGPGLNPDGADLSRPVQMLTGQGIALRKGATPSQKAMLTCLSDVMARLPADWHPVPIGPEAEASLLNWDAEKYRQALAARQ